MSDNFQVRTRGDLRGEKLYSILLSIEPMNKSLSKRIRITKNGKIVRRPMAVDHFRTRTNAKGVRNKRKSRSLDFSLKTLKNY